MVRPVRLASPIKTYRVGGAVRDELMGRAVADRDWVVVGATPEMLIASGFKPVGRDFPVFLHPETHEEYALARTERKHGRGYRGFEFFVSPDVTVEEDLARRDLTINAMARDERGVLIDPFGGRADLAAGILRHVSPAFVEDPLRVLRVARFAARFGFAVAPATLRLMRTLAASGELEHLSPERVWQEVARGLMESHPSRMLRVLSGCGALARLMPEVDALCARGNAARRGTRGAGARLAAALDRAARRELPLPVRYAILAHGLGPARPGGAESRGTGATALRDVRLADRMSARLRVPVECRDAARLAARWHRAVDRAGESTPARILDLLAATDALRRPERLDTLLEVCACIAGMAREGSGAYPAARILDGALAVVRQVDAGAIARAVPRAGGAGAGRSGAIAKALRTARLRALARARTAAATTRPPDA